LVGETLQALLVLHGAHGRLDDLLRVVVGVLIAVAIEITGYTGGDAGEIVGALGRGASSEALSVSYQPYFPEQGCRY
jgi:hypothetical protein